MPVIFQLPESFDPERWRDDPVRTGKLPRFTYFPFGAGFAMMQAVRPLATVAQQFHLELHPTHRVAMQPSITLRPRDGIKVTLQRRGGRLRAH